MSIDTRERRASGEQDAAARSPRDLIITVLVAVVLVVGVLLWRAATNAPATTAPEPTLGVSVSQADIAPASPEVEQAWGIRLTGIYLLADGGLVGLRYEVINEETAHRLHANGGKELPTLTVEDKSGEISSNSVIMHAHYGDGQVNGKTFTILYGNANGLIHTGDRVTVTMTDGLQIQHVLVQD